MHRNISVKKSQNLRKRSELRALTRSNARFAQKNWLFSRGQLAELKRLTEELRLSIVSGELSNIGGKLYVTHSGLLRIAKRHRCSAIRVRPIREFSDPLSRRWVFRAVVHKSVPSEGFIATAMRTHPTFLHSYEAPRCAWPRLAPLTALSGRPTASASARSRSLDGNRRPLVDPIRRDLHRLQITMVIRVGTLASAIAFVF